ncbi:MAG TPA: hypothetical protein VHY80_10680, partial [Stellaceae bacterium]|nr:hypothetical protein [Stellaceae bacterium]
MLPPPSHVSSPAPSPTAPSLARNYGEIGICPPRSQRESRRYSAAATLPVPPIAPEAFTSAT